MFMGYSTQHAGDVYRILHQKTNHVIYSRDVQWLGRMWDEFYSIPSNHSADAYVDPFDDYIEEIGTDQEIENNAQGAEQMWKLKRQVLKKRSQLQPEQKA